MIFTGAYLSFFKIGAIVSKHYHAGRHMMKIS